MGIARILWRSIAALAVTLGVWLLWGLKRPFARTPAARGRLRDQSVHLWGKAVMRVLAVRVERRGEPPKDGFFLVANHLGYLDIPLIASQVPTAFISKAEVANWPLIGWAARSVGILFLRREDKRDLLRVTELLENERRLGNGVVFFPEGTSSEGHQVLPFRPSLLAPAASGRIPVHYAAIRYAVPQGCTPASESVCWWGGRTFGSHILGLLRLPYIEASVSFGETPILDTDRKVLAERLWEAVNERFEPVR